MAFLGEELRKLLSAQRAQLTADSHLEETASNAYDRCCQEPGLLSKRMIILDGKAYQLRGQNADFRMELEDAVCIV